MSIIQIVAVSIFMAMFIAIIVLTKVHRCIPALIGAGLTVVVVFLIMMRSPATVMKVLNFGEMFHARFWLPGHQPLASQGVNWQTIVFIFGMMVMIEGLNKVGFFRWLCLTVAKMVHYQVIPILISFMLLSAFLAMFVDSITVMLFLATVTIELAKLLKFDPIPLIMAEIFAANTGGSATMSGDPPNIIIGTNFGFSFMDFVKNTGLIAWAALILYIVIIYFMFRKSLRQERSASGDAPIQYPEAREAIGKPHLFAIQIAVFLAVIGLLVTHKETGLSVAAIGIIAALLTLISLAGHSVQLLKKVDYLTLIFFFGLFVCVGGLEMTGVLESLARFIGHVSKGNLVVVASVILWISAFASSIVDNIPFAATMCPVLAGLSRMPGMDLKTMSWALALGTDIGGNGTPIGASANVVGTAIAEREGYPVSWGRYCKYAYPAMMLVVLLCNVLLILFHT